MSEDACGNYSENTHVGEKLCNFGYEGNFCAYCSKGFTIISTKCVPCFEIDFFIGSFLPYIILLFLFFNTIKKMDKQSESRIIIKIIINHVSDLSILSLVKELRDSESESFLDFDAITFNVSPSSDNIFSFGCLFQFDGDKQRKVDLIITFISPILFLFLFTLLGDLVSLISKSILGCLKK